MVLHTYNLSTKEAETGMEQGGKQERPIPSDTFLPAKLHLFRQHHYWGPTVQMQNPVGAISHPNHHREGSSLV